MKRNIFDETTRNEVFSRVEKLNAESTGRWGKLNAPQMLRHLSEACRMGLNEISIANKSSFFSRTFVKWLVINNIKPPGREKGKIKTFHEIDIVQLNFPVEELETEKENYKAMLHKLSYTEKLSDHHPMFGKLTHKDWGYLTYSHADYHLTQFNV